MVTKIPAHDTSFFRRLWIARGDSDGQLPQSGSQTDWSDDLARLHLAFQRLKPPGIVGDQITDETGKTVFCVLEVPHDSKEQMFALGLIHDFGFSVVPIADAEGSVIVPSIIHGAFNAPGDKPPFPGCIA